MHTPPWRPVADGSRAPAWPVPAGRDVDVWWLDVRDVTLAGTDLGCLGPEESTRAGSFLFAADRDRYQVAHVLLRRVLAGYCGTSPARVRLRREPCPRCRNPSGKPVLGGHPGSPAGGGARPCFSLAHAGTAVVIAIAGMAVGVDVEREPAGCPCPLADAAHPGDRARLAALAEPGRHGAIIGWWARVEAVVKCTGEGIGHGLGGFPVLAAGSGTPGGGDRGRPAATVHGCSLRPLAAPPGYHAALALAGAGGIGRIARRPAAPLMSG